MGLTGHARILAWTPNELSFLVDDALAAGVPVAENLGLKVEGYFGVPLSNQLRGRGNISFFLDSLILASLLLVNEAAQDLFQAFIASR